MTKSATPTFIRAGTDSIHNLDENIMIQISNRDRLLAPVSGHDHIQGRIDAAVVLVAYVDYQCVTSREVYRMIQAIQQQRQMCFVLRHFPQPHLHPQAQKAAEAAEAAEAQNKFWQMHHLLFERYQLDDGSLLQCADEVQLDINRFLREMTGHVHAERVAQDIQGGIQSGVSRAPTLFVNGVRYKDAWETDRLLTAIL